MKRKGTLILAPHLDGGHLLGLQRALTDLGERDTRIVHLDIPAGLGKPQYMGHVLEHLRSQRPSHVFVLWSPDVSYLSSKQLLILKDLLSASSVLYLQYEGWGRGKPIIPAVRFWLETADIIFHSGGIKALSRYTKPHARVQFVPPCYNHAAFRKAEETPPISPLSNHAVMIANNITRSFVPIPGITGIGDGFKRWVTAALLHHRLGRERFHLYGANWPTNWSGGTIPFHQQVDVMRAGSVISISDHFQKRENYASGRLPTAMLSGRPIVSSQVRAVNWLPRRLPGLTFAHDVISLAGSTQSALERNERDSQRDTSRTWEWVRHRLSTLQLGRFMVEQAFPGAYTSLPFPWGNVSSS